MLAHVPHACPRVAFEMFLSEILDSQDQNTVEIAWATAEQFARLSL